MRDGIPRIRGVEVRLTDRSRVLLTSACMLMLLVGGCGRLSYFFWPFQTKTIPAEFEGLKDHTVAVVIFASETTQYEYPWAVMNLSAMISSNIVANVEGAKAISPQKISAYQRKNLHWMEMDKTKLCKALKADYVLYVSLIEFSTAEKGYIDTLRGTVNGEISIYDGSKREDDARIWISDNLIVKFPEVAIMRTARNEAGIRSGVLRKFSDELAKKFYTYKVDSEELDKKKRDKKEDQ
jgi:hypothetical protein